MNERDDLTPHIRRILSLWNPRIHLVRISKPDTGLSGTVHILTTSDGDLVLRIIAEKTMTWKLEKEAMLHAHMDTLGIPVAQVLHVDRSCQDAPFAWSLARRLPGIPFSTAFSSMTDDDITNVYRSLGDYLGRMHSPTFSGFGDAITGPKGLHAGPAHELVTGDPAQPPGPFATWRQMHDAIIRSRVHLMRGTVFADLIPPVESWFEMHANILPDDVVPRLLHMDLHRGNILIAHGAISGILDIEESIIGHNEYDLMRTELANFRGVNPRFADAFGSAYGTHIPPDAGSAERREFYELSRSLTWIRSRILHSDAVNRSKMSPATSSVHKYVRSLLVPDSRPGA